MGMIAGRTRHLLGLASLTALAVVMVTLWAPVREGYEALLMLVELTARPLPAILDSRPRAVRRLVRFESNGRGYQGDLYQPDDPGLAAIVLVPGAVEAGKDDPRVVRFAMALARARFSVLVPDMVALRQLTLLPETARDVADALAWMLAQPGLVPQGRLGLLTTSVALGPAMLALHESESAQAVRFVVSVGGYYDLPRTLVYLTTGTYAANGVALQRQPNEYGKWVYGLSYAVRIEDDAEREAFRGLARRKLGDPEADVTDQLAHIGPVGRSIYDLIVNDAPARTAELIMALPSRLRADMKALDLASQDLKAIEARFILIHGIDDDLIPYGESIALARALRSGQAQQFLIEGLYHVNVESGFVDGWRLWQAIRALLRERER